MQTTSQTLLPGAILRGNSYTYQIEDLLGQGTFGITYLATTRVKIQGALGELETEMQVAIKEFFLKETNNREATGAVAEASRGNMTKEYGRKFLKEAENLSHLNHPNIVRILEVFSTNNTHYYVMEYVKGSNLDDYIKEKGGLPEKEAIACIGNIGNALSYMHSCKMLHLDLKPKNIMRRENGHLYLIDFGLSKQYDEKGEPESSTSIGQGTPGYAPLEQTNMQNEKDFTATLDVYALGATLYKTLIAQTPPNASVIMNEGFPQEELRLRNVSEQTIDAIRQAMTPMKKLRPQSIHEFLRLLDGQRGNNKKEEEDTIISKKPEEELKKRETSQIEKQEDTQKEEPKKPQKQIPETKVLSAKKTSSLMVYQRAGIAVITSLAIGISIWLFTRNNNASEQIVPDTIAAVTDSTSNENAINTPAEDTMNSGAVSQKPADTDKPSEKELAYQNELKAGTSMYNKKQYESAKKIFTWMQSKYPTHKAEIKQWITKCNNRLEESSQTIVTIQTTETHQEPKIEEKPKFEEEQEIFDVVEKMPEFPGGNTALMSYLAKNINYPTIAQENGVQGRVLVQFVVNKDGTIVDAKVARSIDPYLDKEALRVVNSMPKWNPGMVKNKPVRVKYTIPVMFRLQ